MMCLYVFYRSVMASETERLTGLSEFWELRFDDSSIPEESELTFSNRTLKFSLHLPIEHIVLKLTCSPVLCL